MVLSATDLPEPVVPAMSKWGILARSAITESPPMVLPSARISGARAFSYSLLPSSSRRYTVSRCWLGSSMPMTLRPGITAMRAATADMERATSSDSETTREDLTPAAGSNS